MAEKQQDKQQDSNYKHIVRIANVDVPGNKHIRISLQSIKGVGDSLAQVACNLTGIDIKKKTGNLSEQEVAKLTKVLTNPLEAKVPNWMLNHRKDYDSGVDKHHLGGTLGFVRENDVKRLMKIKCLRGQRHSRRLPVRGQRTKSNFRRTKGKVVGVKKKGK